MKIDNNKIFVEFVDAGEEFDRELEIGNFDLYKNGVKTIDFEWRQDISVNQELDACDKMGIWYQSTVIELRVHRGDDCRKVSQAKIGYRYYSDTGNKKDEDQ
jgi:hypothetical protein